MTTPTQSWLAAFATRLGVDEPDDAERDAILALAGTAAHASERSAAPIACWMAAASRMSVLEALEVAREIALPEAT